MRPRRRPSDDTESIIYAGTDTPSPATTGPMVPRHWLIIFLILGLMTTGSYIYSTWQQYLEHQEARAFRERSIEFYRSMKWLEDHYGHKP